MDQTNVIVFSSVQMEYVTKVVKLTDKPVRFICSLSEQDYRRLAGGSRWQRLGLRVQMYLGFPVKLAWGAVWAPRNSILLVSSNPFFSPLLAWVCSRISRPKVVHWRCDLYPDALVVARTIKAGGFLERFIGHVQRLMHLTCDDVVSVGDYLRIHAEMRWGRPRCGHYIDNVPSDENQFSSNLTPLPGALVFHYGGQLGHMHEPASFLEFIRTAQHIDKGVRFDFRMSGVHREGFSRELARLGLSASGPVANAQWKLLIAEFQLGLVSLSPGGATVSLPSKIYSMMAGGLAIVAICPVWSDLAQIILKAESGWVINNSPFESVEELLKGDYAANCAAQRSLDLVAEDSARLVELLLADRNLVEQRRKAAVRAAHGAFGVAELKRRWAEVL